MKLTAVNDFADESSAQGFAVLVIALVFLTAMAVAAGQPAESREAQEPQSQALQASAPWQYGGFADVSYLLDFNDPANKLFRSRGTAWHVTNCI